MSMTDNTRYPAILFISKVIRFFAWCSLILTVLAMVFTLVVGLREGFSAILAFFGIGIFGGFLTLALFAIAESMIVLIDIEYNTRSTSSSILKVADTASKKIDAAPNFNNSNKLESQNEPRKVEKLKVKSVAEAIRKLTEAGIDVKITEAGATDNKYLITKGTTTKYIYKDAELIDYANEI